MNKILAIVRSSAFRIGFLVLALAAAVWAVVENYDGVRSALDRLQLWQLAASAAISLIFVWMTMRSWRVILNDTGAEVPDAPARRIFFISQVAKYLPGGVWNFLAAAELGADYKISRRRSVSVLLISMVVSVVTGLGLGAGAILLGPADLLSQFWWVLLVLPVFAAVLYPPLNQWLVNRGLRLLRRQPLEKPVSARAMVSAAAWSLGSWAISGLQVWIILTGLGAPARAETYFLTLGGYALAWVAGFLIFFVPAGVGIREVALGATLAGVATAGDIVVIVLASRLLFTLADIVLGIGASIAARRALSAPESAA